MKQMKLMLFSVLCASFSTLSFAAVEQCRSIASDTERLACYDRETKTAAQPAKPQILTREKTKAKTVDTVDHLKVENDRVSARLKGICRGC